MLRANGQFEPTFVVSTSTALNTGLPNHDPASRLLVQSPSPIAREGDGAVQRGFQEESSPSTIPQQDRPGVRRLYGEGDTGGVPADRLRMLTRSLWDLMEAGRYDEAQAAWDKVNVPLVEFYRPILQKSGGESRIAKAMSEVMGLPMGPPRPPSIPLSKDEIAGLRELMTGWGWPVPKPSEAATSPV